MGPLLHCTCLYYRKYFTFSTIPSCWKALGMRSLKVVSAIFMLLCFVCQKEVTCEAKKNVLFPEPVFRRCSSKRMFLKLLQYSQENACVRVFFIKVAGLRFFHGTPLVATFLFHLESFFHSWDNQILTFSDIQMTWHHLMPNKHSLIMKVNIVW